MKFGVGIAANSRYLSLVFGHGNSFSFGVENVSSLKMSPPFKCTVDKKLLTLITSHSKVLCD